MRTGITNLPLHGGKAPRWLFDRMVLLAREIGLVICYEKGPEEFMDKLSDPFWFQAFGCVLGFDWHSSGLTTTVCGAIKEAFKPHEKEIGIFICGGKGGTSRKTPGELQAIADKGLLKINPEKLIYASKMSAKVDNTALQDGYQLYHHTFICTRNGDWAVIQQGMNEDNKWARRYHWLSKEIDTFVEDPHKAICCNHKGTALNMVAKESKKARTISTDISKNSPEKTVKEYEKIKSLTLAPHHDVRTTDIKPENLYKILLKTYEKNSDDFEGLLATEGVGPKTIRALALMSELVYGEKPSFIDPVRFSFAHGGKDGHPYPVNREVYDASIQFLNRSITKARIGSGERLKAFRRLSDFVSQG